jgi:hypothetical protein
VHPLIGDDNLPGTSLLEPFRTVKQALQSTSVQTAANLGGGTNVIVRIIYDGEEDVGGNITSQTLTAGSVTVLPDSGVNFTLKLNGNLLTLKKGYRLQGFRIKSGDPGTSSNPEAAITLNAEGTPLKDMVIDCTRMTTSGASAVGQGDKCVHVTSSVSGTVTLENVRITIPSSQSFVTGILHEGSGTLKVTNSSVVAVSSGQKQGVVGIYGNTAVGSVEVVGSTVSLSGIQASGGNVFAVLLSPIGSGRVERSGIQVREGAAAGGGTGIAIGVCVNANASGTVNVQDNRFTNVTNTSPGPTSIAIHRQAGTVVSTGNTFIDFSSSNQYVQSGSSCP